MNAMDLELSRLVQESLEELPSRPSDASGAGPALGDEEIARMARAFVFSMEHRAGTERTSE